jgi:hypothetical protein
MTNNEKGGNRIITIFHFRLYINLLFSTYPLARQTKSVKKENLGYQTHSPKTEHQTYFKNQSSRGITIKLYLTQHNQLNFKKLHKITSNEQSK